MDWITRYQKEELRKTLSSFTELNKGALENFIKKFEANLRGAKIIKATSLFEVEPAWKLLNEKKCPICGSKLRLTRNGLIAFCMGKRHGDKRKFVIRRAILEGTLKIQK